MRLTAAVLITVLAAAPPAAAQDEADLPPLPSTGVDVTGLDHFWAVVDTYAVARVPSEEQWRDFLATPGYRLAVVNVPTVREDLEVALDRSRSAERDSLVRASGDRASRVRHLLRAVGLRTELQVLADSLRRAPPIEEARRRAAPYLPPGATDATDPPLVGLALFRYDGYAMAAGTVVDLLYVHDNGLTSLLAHEFHHVYRGTFDELERPPFDHPFGPLIQALTSLRTEGSADLVDKPRPLVARSAGMERYVARYNAEYARAPEALRTLDSLLVVVGEDPAEAPAAGRQARRILWSNGHAHGAYMARTIDEMLGREAFWEALRSPFRFVRAFVEAEGAAGRPAVFTAAGLALLDDLEPRFTRRR